MQKSDPMNHRGDLNWVFGHVLLKGSVGRGKNETLFVFTTNVGEISCLVGSRVNVLDASRKIRSG
jgi:hypothetical protein